jgi:uncharacterized protein (TIGR02996 family)
MTTMPLDPALLRAVIESPDDDLPRLLAADYLEEHGEQECGEFIRIQIDLAKALSPLAPLGKLIETVRPWIDPDKAVEQVPVIADLRKRERELLERHQGEWTPKARVVDNSQRQYYEYVRGFPSRLTLSFADWQAHSAALLAGTPATDSCG